jgi:ATP-binding cassette subfamily F protein 3
MEDYRRLLIEQRRNERTAQRTATGSEKAVRTPNRKDERRAKAEARQAVAHLKREVKAAEARMDELNGEIERLEREMADPTLYDGNPKRLTALQIRHAELNSSLKKTEETWLEAQGRIESENTNDVP